MIFKPFHGFLQVVASTNWLASMDECPLNPLLHQGLQRLGLISRDTFDIERPAKLEEIVDSWQQLRLDPCAYLAF
ncbi:hypothetical protein [Xanthomonas bromi]|uniref:Uncharacterized protein n=1 Tax=Xanthomonas bromi TaxID=56449 RepID=A0ABX5BRK3_9XANT|nr:hypothetical protein [Xanthomonas bromi]PPV07355.1 hypothetical protein XbrCFBP1976_08230 [Xanthomonas bromi]